MISLQFCNVKDVILNDGKFPFSVTDVASVLEGIKRDVDIVRIVTYEGTQEEKKNDIKKAIQLLGAENDDKVILIDAFASTKEYPTEEYYLVCPEEGKKELPIKEVLERESKMLDDIGFESINFYVRYEYKIAYIYPNKIGLEVINFMKDSNPPE